MVAILIVVLIGIAALALDVGRLLVLRAEMQNAVDAAALAAAAELNSQSGARVRAVNAAKTLLQHSNHFAQVNQLLGDTLTVCAKNADQTDCDMEVSFYCAIENDVENEAPNLLSECPENPDTGEIKYPANTSDAVGDRYAHYVSLKLNPKVEQGNDENEPQYSIDLYFLPVLRTIGINVADEASTTAQALAGRSFVFCNYPPLMICNPYELSNPGKELTVGQQVKLYMGASSPGYWAPGDFGLLEPPTGKGGAVDVSEYLASSGFDCSDPYITTKTGVQVNMVKWGLNTRFGIYEHKYNANGYPPAPNVLDYPRDLNLDPNDAAYDSSARVGTSVWQNTAGEYWADYLHTGTDPIRNTRFEYYQWEINNNDYPTKAVAPDIQCNPIDNNGCPTHSTIWKGRPTPDNQVADLDRRVITVPVLNCTELGINGKEKNIWVPQEKYWKRFFITEHVDDPSAGAEIFAEYLGNVGNRDGTFHVEVQLYE